MASAFIYFPQIFADKIITIKSNYLNTIQEKKHLAI